MCCFRCFPHAYWIILYYTTSYGLLLYFPEIHTIFEITVLFRHWLSDHTEPWSSAAKQWQKSSAAGIELSIMSHNSCIAPIYPAMNWWNMVKLYRLFVHLAIKKHAQTCSFCGFARVEKPSWISDYRWSACNTFTSLYSLESAIFIMKMRFKHRFYLTLE